MKKKILAVDDDLLILKGLEILLEDAGFEVCCCSNGKEVKDCVTKFKPDLIVLDIMLDSMDGRDIARDIKDTPALKNIPIIMISANPHMEKNIHACGADMFIAKPFDSQKMISTISTKVQKPVLA